MKHLIKKISILSLVILSFLLINSCKENDNSNLGETLEAKFTRTGTGRTITFINISENATSYSWDFGDDTTSKLANPVKRFSDGTYTVTLKSFNKSGDFSTFVETFAIEGCTDETAENTDPSKGDLNWTFLNTDGNSGFDAFGNIGGGIAENPVLDAVNSSCNVYTYIKTSGCETWSGVGYVLNAPLDFSTLTKKIFKMKVLATTQIADVTLLLEFKPFPNNNPFQQRVASITKVGEWQEITFDFSDLNSGTFENIVIYFERNVACDGDIYFFDDIIQQ